jgi:hypothetical protein
MMSELEEVCLEWWCFFFYTDSHTFQLKWKNRKKEKYKIQLLHESNKSHCGFPVYGAMYFGRWELPFWRNVHPLS